METEGTGLGYWRQIAYVYSYRNRVRGKNVGFIKVVKRQDRICLQVFLRQEEEPENSWLEVYGVTAKGREVLGRIKFFSGEGIFTYEGKEPSKDSGELQGLYFEPEERGWYLAGMWDGGEYFPEPEPEVRTKAVPEVIPEIISETVPKVIAQRIPEVIPGAEPETISQEFPKEKPTDPGSEISAAAEVCEKPVREMYFSPIWDMLARRYGKCRPFAEDRGIQCVQIKPMDLGRLKEGYRNLSANSFLMHGYYRYDHLLLMRVDSDIFTKRIAPGMRAEGSRPRYLLGVPGYYQGNEKNLAGMFGFPDFLSASARSGTGEGFGYWYMEVELP